MEIFLNSGQVCAQNKAGGAGRLGVSKGKCCVTKLGVRFLWHTLFPSVYPGNGQRATFVVIDALVLDTVTVFVIVVVVVAVAVVAWDRYEWRCCSEIEKEALLSHFSLMGERMGIKGVRNWKTWDDADAFQREYEASVRSLVAWTGSLVCTWYAY